MVDGFSQEQLTPKTFPSYTPKCISHSQMESYKRCPYYYYLRYVLKAKGPSNHYAGFGSLIHDLCEKDGRMQLQGKKRYSLQGLWSEYEKAWREATIPWPSAATKENYYKNGFTMLEHYASQRSIYLSDVECRFRMDIGVGVPVMGFIDAVRRTPLGIVITDYKTGNPYPKDKLAKDPQLTLYALVGKELFGEWPYRLEFSFLKTGDRPQVARTEDDAEQLKLSYKTNLQQIQSGAFDSVCSNTWWCANLCEFGPSCPGRRRYASAE